MGDHRGGGPQTQGSLGSPPSCDACALLSSATLPPTLPTRPTHTLLWGKLRPRPHSKFPGPSQHWGCPHPRLPAATWMEASRRPGWGIPRAQAAFQPATSASASSARQWSAQRLQSPWGHTAIPPQHRCSGSNRAMSALGCGVPPPQILLEVETEACRGAGVYPRSPGNPG